MTGPAGPRPLRRSPSRRRAARLWLAGCALWPALAAAQDAWPLAGPSAGFAALPSFAWPRPAEVDAGRWSGSYASLSTGFEAVSSRRFGGYAGPTLGFEAGRLWQEGPFVYGIVGGLDYLSPAYGGGAPGFGRLAYARDLAGALQAQVGVLLTPDVLLYAKAGGWAVHETLRAGPTAATAPFAREGIAVRPDARAGVAWAVTDRLTLSLEAGVTRGAFPW